MNSALFLVIGIAAIIIFAISKRILLVIAAGVAQYYSGALSSWVGLNKIPLFDFDTELSNILIALAAFFFGFREVIILIGVSIIVHFFHVEVLSALSILDRIIKGVFIGAGIALFSSANPFLVIPYTIIASKVFGYFYNVAFFGSPLLGLGTLYEGMAISVYLAISRIHG